MEDTKAAFIICVNDEIYYRECVRYLNQLKVPEGCSLEVFAVRNAESMCSGYNQAMRQSDAKYKIYMHQDVFIINRDFLESIISFFALHPRAGLLGVMGCRELPVHRRFYREWDIGNVLGYDGSRYFHNDLSRGESIVKAVDGMMMVTQHDIFWREDCLTGWDFYDFSQSLEFIRKGYEVWVPAQKEPWCLHDCGRLNLTEYDEAQREFLREYGACFSLSGEAEVMCAGKREYCKLMAVLKDKLKEMVFSGSRQRVKEIVDQYYDERYIDTEWVILKKLLEEDEIQRGVLADSENWRQAYEMYMRMLFEHRWEKYERGTCIPDI